MADSENKSKSTGFAAVIEAAFLPAANLIGKRLGKRVENWLNDQPARAKQMLTDTALLLPPDAAELPPRLVVKALVEGSQVEDQRLREMWVRLLASSSSADGLDEDNLGLMDTLSRMTAVEGRVLESLCRRMNGQLTEVCKEVWSQGFFVNMEAEALGLTEETFEAAAHRLVSLGLIEYERKGSAAGEALMMAPPTQLGLRLFARCQGWRGSIKEYFHSLLEKLQDRKSWG